MGGIIRPSVPLGFVALQALRGVGAPRKKYGDDKGHTSLQSVFGGGCRRRLQKRFIVVLLVYSQNYTTFALG